MRIEQLTEGLKISFFVRINDEQLTFDSTIQEVFPKKRLVLAEAVYKDDKVISFKGARLIVDVLVFFPDDKPQLFKNVSVNLMKRADGSHCYNLVTIAESKSYNRRRSFRCYVGAPTSITCGSNSAAYDAIIKDVSMEGFSVVCSDEVQLYPDQIIHAVLNDYIDELAENFTFHLYGLVARVVELENNRILYGCRLNTKVAGLDAYIMKKERIRLKKPNGGNL